MATLATQQVTLTGLNVTMSSAAGGGDKLRPHPNAFLIVRNAGAGSINVTVDRVRLSNTGEDDNLVVAVGVNETKHIGPLPAEWFAAASDGLVAVTYSGVSSVTVASVIV